LGGGVEAEGDLLEVVGLVLLIRIDAFGEHGVNGGV